MDLKVNQGSTQNPPQKIHLGELLWGRQRPSVEYCGLVLTRARGQGSWRRSPAS